MIILSLTTTVVPLGICVALPVLIVWIIYRAATNSDNRRAEILIEAIRSNAGIDADKIAASMAKTARTPRQVLNLRLLRGLIFTLSGVAMTALYFIVKSPMQEIFVSCGALSAAIGLAYLITYGITRKDVEHQENGTGSRD